MSRRSTKDTLAGGNFMSVINILMQLRKVCNHPDLFDPRPIISPFETDTISLEMASAVLRALEYEPLKVSLVITLSSTGTCTIHGDYFYSKFPDVFLVQRTIFSVRLEYI